MNAAPNKLLIGLGVVFVLGCGGLGYLLVTSAGRYSAMEEEYLNQSNEYNRLRKLPLYPDAANLEKLQEQEKIAVEATEALRKKLEPLAFPLESITPEQFQDKLRASVSALNQKAAEASVALPGKFYLGFDQYQSQPPKAEAAAPLWRQLKAIEFVVATLIENKVQQIGAITRPTLPEENGVKNMAAPLVSKFPFEIQFTADQANFRSSFNEIVRNNHQLFVTRSIHIQNTNEKTTSKASSAPVAVPITTEEGGDAAPKEQKEAPLKYVVGTEKVNVTLGLEIVVVANAFPK